MNPEPLSIDELLLRRKSLKRRLSAMGGLQPIRIAVLGGSTTSEVVDLLEVFLLAAGFRPTFYQSEYGRFYEEAVVDPSELIAFAPDIVYLHTSCLNVQTMPPVHATAQELQVCVDAVVEHYEQIWSSLQQHLTAQVIQNNFELPPYGILGNLDSVSGGGSSRFLLELNARFARAAEFAPRLLLQDVLSLSARLGLDRWFDWDRYFGYKVLNTIEASIALARSLTSIVQALYGKSRKVLVLDLDNTLWGGVIGDDGVDKLQIGRETAVAEAYAAFQEYCLSLQRRGVLLAVCSKNDEQVAKQGFEHPDSVLKLEHISCFKANWEPKHENLLAIARELNLGVESFVFVDDNPAERAIVRAQIPGVAVPEVGSEVSRFAAILEQQRYFEPVSLSQEDLGRPRLYQTNARRAVQHAQFADYGEYLDSLEMIAEIERFKPVYLERIAQLTNKTNQFNLTTRRYTLAEMEAIARDSKYLSLYGRLSDRFGDNGLVSIVLGRRDDKALQLDLWLMSCRVLKRDMELAMLDELVEQARSAGVETLRGYYLPSKKNGMVADHYQRLGFQLEARGADGESTWTLEVNTYTPRNTHIKILETVREGV